MSDSELKSAVREHWDRDPCGTVYAQGDDLRQQLETQAATRYALEPYLLEFARFADGAGKDVLEIGVGMGADHLEWARSHPRSLTGVDLTPAAIQTTRSRLELSKYQSQLSVADAEHLEFPDNSFDLAWSWGVLHHSPRTPMAVNEVLRVLRPGGQARVMIYHTASIVGYMLWVRYALLAGRPWRSLREIYADHLESAGTKAYSVAQTREMFAGFKSCDVRICLSFGDLLEGQVGQRHRGWLLNTARALWPRPLLRTFAKNHGLYLLIDAVK